MIHSISKMGDVMGKVRDKIYNKACFQAYLFSCFCVFFFFMIYQVMTKPIDIKYYLGSLVIQTPIIFAFGIVGYSVSWFMNGILYKRNIKSYWAWFGFGLIVTFTSIALLILVLQGIGVMMAPLYILGGTCMSLAFPYMLKHTHDDGFEGNPIELQKRQYIDETFVEPK